MLITWDYYPQLLMSNKNEMIVDYNHEIELTSNRE